jgi:general secretion pathway protein D
MKAGCLTLLSIMLASCELLPPKRATLTPLAPIPKAQTNIAIKEGTGLQSLQNKPLSDALQKKIEMFPSRDRFAPRTETHRRSKTGGPGTYSLNFDDADLGEVAKVILSDILGQNYVLSPKVAGKVTLNTTEALTKDELLPTLEMVLGMNNAALVKDGKIYHIEPKTEALYSSTIAGSSTGYQTRVIPIRNVAAQEIADILKPLVREKTILGVDSTRNTLTASGTADELARVMDMIDTFDIDMLRGRSFALFPLSHADPEQIIDELETIFNTSSGKEDSEFFSFLPIERMNAILAITQQASYLKDVENWIYRLDRANTESGGGINVYRVQHMDAEELADTLNEIFTGGGGGRDKSAKVAAGRKSAEASNKSAGDSQQPDNTASSSTSGGSASGTSSTSRKKSKSSKSKTGSSSGGGSKDNDISIVADIANNSLIITATPQEYGKILPIIKQLDIMPLQVLIDATIAEVSLKDDLQYGLKWYFSQGQGNGFGSSGSNTPSTSATKLFGQGTVERAIGSAALAGATGGLSAIYNAGTVKAVLDAQALLNNVKIISSPSLMVINNQEASIEVGDQIPTQTSQLTTAVGATTSGSGLAQNSQIQYKDTGVLLEITPRVNSNGIVIMEIHQRVSNVVPQGSGSDSTLTPTISKKDISSVVAVNDGETLALGGLIKNQVDFVKSGIPFLHELPYVGSLFGSTTRNDDRTELVVLITPRVVKTTQDARIVTDEFKRKLTGIYYDPTKPKKKTSWWRARDW